MSPETMTVKIKALCSVPRLGWNDHFGSMWDTLSRFQIPYGFYSGAYWDKCIAKAFEDSIDIVDLILAFDYDTLATPQHIRRMIDVMCNNLHIDALAANQPRRSTGMPLWTIKGNEGFTEVACEGPVKCHTAHFGCTMIRTAALKRMPKPWFPKIPADDGSAEGKGQVDPDIQFWNLWNEAGNSLYVEPSVCIGHLEAMVSYFEQTEKPSLNQQLELKRKELADLETFVAHYEGDKDEQKLELTQAHIYTAQWREKFGGKNGMLSLGERETR